MINDDILTARVFTILEKANEYFKDRDKTSQWFYKSNLLLDGDAPVDYTFSYYSYKELLKLLQNTNIYIDNTVH